MDTKTHTRTVTSAKIAGLICGRLAHESVYFSCTPLPDDHYEIAVKADRAGTIAYIFAECVSGIIVQEVDCFGRKFTCEWHREQKGWQLEIPNGGHVYVVHSVGCWLCSYYPPGYSMPSVIDQYKNRDDAIGCGIDRYIKQVVRNENLGI